MVIIRHGALGDVLAVRPVLRFFKDSFPEAEITLIAPGEKGRFFRRDGWADRVYDWDRKEFSWLFSEGHGGAPVSLRAAFGGSDIIVAYQDFDSTGAREGFENRLNRLAPSAGKVFCPPSPPAGHEQPIGEWLLAAAVGFCERFGLLSVPADLSPWIGAKLVVARRSFPGLEQPYLVMHPGSGGRRKNWAVDNFAVLAKLLLASSREKGGRLRLLVTAGEADGDLGDCLASAVPGTLLLKMPELEVLAAVLAYARYYVGNDSGVSHLASAVCGEEGAAPLSLAVFGPTDAVVWAPRGAAILFAGAMMEELSPDAAFSRIRVAWPEFA